MVTLEELNQLRQEEKWEEILQRTRTFLEENSDASFALRAQVQALEHLEQKEEEYEGALFKLVELNDRIVETSHKLAQYYLNQGESEEAIRYYEIALENAVSSRQYDAVEEIWLEFSEAAPNHIDLFLRVADQLSAIKQKQRASILLQTILPALEEREDWRGRYFFLKRILELTPKEKSLRDLFVDTLKKLHPVPQMDRVMDHTRIRIDRPLPEAIEEMELFMHLLPDSYLRHPDWGVGRVTDLDMTRRRVVINFQRKRDHGMDVELAQKAVEPLDENDFRVQRVINREGLIQHMREEPLDFIKTMLKSFGGAMTAKEIKENLVPGVINVREWTTWWSKANSAMRRDPYIAVSGGSAKHYTLRSQAASDEEEFLKRFDETKAPHSKVDLIYEYLRTTKKSDIHEQVIRHFSKKLHVIAPRRRSTTERVELWYVNENLKDYVESIESMPIEIVDASISNTDKFIRVLQRLRFKTHQWQYACRFQTVRPDHWADIFQQLLLEPVVLIRDELAEALKEGGEIERVKTVIDQTSSEFRQLPHTFIWLAGRVLMHDEDWLDGKISKSSVIERLLLLVDYLTSQAKRREKEDALWLRKVAGDARDLIRRDHYRLFKKFIQTADESSAQSIYRRAQTNEGLDARTSADLTTIVRARFPDLFSVSTAHESAIPEGLLCLKETYQRKQKLFKRLVSLDLPEVVQEIEIARQQGDLRENAEYHAARDKQKLLAAQTAELEEALHSAKSIDLSSLTLERIEFGVLFKISPSGSDVEEEFIMLGPWESNPDKHILSYMAPFAMAFMGKKKGEFVELEMPTLTGRYEIVSIEAIPPDRLQEVINSEKKEAEAPQNENSSVEEASVPG